jgi:flagella basal body P-ring formation protein FlgA
MNPMVVLFLALFAFSGPAQAPRASVPSAVSESLTRALAIPGGRIVPLSWSESRACHVREAIVPRPITGSGRVTVKLVGPGCAAWGWVSLEVWATTAVTTRAVRSGERLASALALIEQLIRPGRVPFVPAEGALAARVLPAGRMIDASDVSDSSVAAGDSVKIVVVSGAVAVETRGRRVTCGSGRACAVLASGKHLEGRMDADGQLLVEVPQ